jgi:hypothetical protein
MNVKIVEIPTDQIVDWKTFHDVFKTVFGFPNFYGANMDAWIDCMSYLDDAGSDMSKITVSKDEVILIKLNNVEHFVQRCKEQFDAFVECLAFVNSRYVEAGGVPILALMPVGR